MEDKAIKTPMHFKPVLRSGLFFSNHDILLEHIRYFLFQVKHLSILA
jgi:hypothetical protein